MAQPQTGELRHKVQLRRPTVPDFDRVQLYLIVPEDNELAFDPLPGRIIL